VRPHTYEITFSGQAGRTLRAQFDECKVTTGPDTTILRAELPDQAALSGLVQRIVGLGLVIIDVHMVTPGSGPWPITGYTVPRRQHRTGTAIRSTAPTQPPAQHAAKRTWISALWVILALFAVVLLLLLVFILEKASA
jgi:hypothetical protein